MLFAQYPANSAEQLINILEAYSNIKPVEFSPNKFARAPLASYHLIQVMREMGFLVDENHGLFELFQLISEVEKSVLGLEKYRKIDKRDMQRRLQPIYKFKEYLIVNSPVTSDSGKNLKEYLEISNLISVLIGFNDDILNEKGKTRFSDDFINNLLTNFHNLEKDVLESDLEKDIKKIILSRIFEIVNALKNYRLYGIENLRIISSSSVGVLLIEDVRLRKDGTKNHPVLKKCFANFAALAIATVGFANDFENYLLPKFEQFSKSVRIAEESDFQDLSAEEIIDAIQKTLEEESRVKLLPAGKTDEPIKALPQVDEDAEVQ